MVNKDFYIYWNSCIVAYDCVDIDECTVNNGGCSADANCTNIPGSFTCACEEGYTAVGLTCTGKSWQSKLFARHSYFVVEAIRFAGQCSLCV